MWSWSFFQPGNFPTSGKQKTGQKTRTTEHQTFNKDTQRVGRGQGVGYKIYIMNSTEESPGYDVRSSFDLSG